MTRKHLPTRTCIACRRIKPKRDMIRIVRNPDGIIELDESGKANGRGGYLCQHFLCWHRALKKRAALLKRTLKANLNRERYLVLKEFSMQYKPAEEEKPEKVANEENQVEGKGTTNTDTQAKNVEDANTQPNSTTDEQATTQKKNSAQNVTEEKKEESS